MAVLRFHSSSLEGGAPAVLPVSGSVADFYAGRGAGMIPWNLKSQWTENGGRREDESSKWGKGAVMAGERRYVVTSAWTSRESRRVICQRVTLFPEAATLAGDE